MSMLKKRFESPPHLHIADARPDFNAAPMFRVRRTPFTSRLITGHNRKRRRAT